MFTQDNTSGFTDAELDIMNDVRAELLQGLDDDDVQHQKNIDDAIMNAWTQGVAQTELVARVQKKIR